MHHFVDVLKDRTCIRLTNSCCFGWFFFLFFFVINFYPMPFLSEPWDFLVFYFLKVAMSWLWRLTVTSIGRFITKQFYLRFSSSAFQSKLQKCPCLFSQYKYNKNKDICVIAGKLKLTVFISFNNLCCLILGLNIHSVLPVGPVSR